MEKRPLRPDDLSKLLLSKLSVSLIPRPLTPTGRVAVAAPASAAIDAADAHAGIAAMRARGLTVEPGRAFVQPDGFLSGPDDERADELNALLARTDLDAVVCLRGGYGVLRILDLIDYDAARAVRPLVVGYSDITALHLALYTQSGLTGLSGPMVAPDWPTLDAETEAHFWRLASGEANVDIAGPGSERPFGLASGDAEGVLLGGNLSMVAALIGTPYFPDMAGAILVVEDVGEAPYRIDGLLARLRLAGVLEKLGGLVFGLFTDAEPPEGRPSATVDEVLDHYAQFVDGPVAAGLTYGHVRRRVTLPIGVRARLTVDGPAARLVALTPVTQEV